MSEKINTYLQSKLNDQQYAAASYVTGNSLILAWAGSGKTRTLTYKIANLIYGHGVDEESILAVTFTNKAAAEMRERLEHIIADMKTQRTWSNTWEASSSHDEFWPPDDFVPPEAQLPSWMGWTQQYQWIGTFHSIFLKILKQDIEEIGFLWKKNFVIYDSADSTSMIKNIIKAKKYGEIVDAKDAKFTISQWKNKGYHPEQAWLHCESQSQERILEVYQEYWKQCQDANALDFDDLLLLPKLLFDKAPAVLAKRQNTFSHILVDEAQDTNTIQFDLMKQLSQGKNELSKTITFIGDDYQSIYRWRWAVMQNFLNLENLRPGIETFKLEINYRSLPHIVEAGNAIIKQNKVQYDKNIKAFREGDKHIRVFEFADERDEAAQIIEMIAKVKEEADKSRSDFTILYRTNAQSVPFEQVCIADSIPYKIVWGRKFFERKEVKDILSYVRFLSNPSDSLALKRIINTPWRWIGKTSIEQCEAIGAQKQLTFSQVVMNIEEHETSLKPAAYKKLLQFKTMIHIMLQNLIMQTPSELIDQITRGIKYEAHAIKQDGKEKGEERMANIGQLINMATRFTETGLETVTFFLDEVSLMTSIEEASADDAEAIKMMSVHGSKWLEFPYVFIVGVEENILPLAKAKFDDAELEEERRGMYVAITRAQDHLFLSYAASRMQRGQLKYNQPSRFIEEIPEHLVKKYTMSNASAYQWTAATVDRDEGARVKHKLFGPGVILEVWDRICIVRFDNAKFNVRKLEGKWLKEE